MIIYFESSVCLLCNIVVNIGVGQLLFWIFIDREHKDCGKYYGNRSAKSKDLSSVPTQLLKGAQPGAEQSQVWALLGAETNLQPELTAVGCHLTLCHLHREHQRGRATRQLCICCGTC